jgi:hypothetical protein
MKKFFQQDFFAKIFSKNADQTARIELRAQQVWRCQPTSSTLLACKIV